MINRKTPLIVAAFFVGSATTGYTAQDSADDRLKAVSDNVFNFSSATINISVLDVGAEKSNPSSYILKYKSFPDGSEKALLSIESPASQKGTLILASAIDNSLTQWVYTPSTNRVRKVTTDGDNTNPFNTKINYRDLTGKVFKQVTAVNIQQGSCSNANECETIIQASPKSAKLGYSRVDFTVTSANQLRRLDYISADSKITKTIIFDEYKSFSSSGLKPSKITIDDKTANAKMEISVVRFDPESQISPTELTPTFLERKANTK